MDESLYSTYAVELANYFTLPYYDCTKTEGYIIYKINHSYLSWEEVITYVNLGLENHFYTNIQIITEPYSLTVLVNKYNQLPNDYIPADLEEIDVKYNASSFVLGHEAREAFEVMCDAAGEEGINLMAVSTFRSFNYQEEVYLRKKTSDISMEEYQIERDKVSARAGHSEHQTGLAVDINELEQTFENTPAGKWLKENSYQFGFILRYPKGKEKITGYDYEPWHFRYLGYELAEAVFLSDLTYDEYYIRFILPFNNGLLQNI